MTKATFALISHTQLSGDKNDILGTKIARINSVINRVNSVYNNAPCGASLSTLRDMEQVMQALKGANEFSKQLVKAGAYGEQVAKLDSKMAEVYGIFY